MLRKSFVVFVSALVLGTTALSADVVTDWNAITATTIAASAHGGPSQMLDFATVHVAMHDAVQAYQHRFRPYRTRLTAAAGSPVVAAARAARDVLVNRFPAQAATIDSTYMGYLGAHGFAADDAGVVIGEQAAAGVIAFRATDKSFPPVPGAPFTGGDAVGQWRPTPSYLPGAPAAFSPMATPWLAGVTPFAIKSGSQFRAKEPPALTSSEYAADFNEVKALGSAVTAARTPAQTEAAYFWSDNTPVQWNRALRGVASTYVSDIGDSARLFALATMAAADALITCWDSKLTYALWRPVTAIHHAAEDGNPDTDADVNWRPLLNTPNYPDYTSGANSVTASMTRTLELFFGTDEMSFSVTSNSPNLPPDKRTRTYSRFSDAAAEVVEARIYLGFHFRFADVAAREQGERIAKWAFTHHLKPVDGE